MLTHRPINPAANRARTRVGAAIATATAVVALAAPGIANAASWENAQVAGNDGRYPSVAVGSDRVVHSAFRGPGGIVYNNKVGTLWQSATTIAPVTEAGTRQFGPGPLIAVDNQGVVTIAWREQASDGNLTISAARRTPDGVVTTETIATGGHPGNSFDLAVAENTGAAAIVFAGANGQLYAARRAPGAGDFGPAEPTGLADYPLDGPVADVGDDGTVAVAFSSSAVQTAVRPAGATSWDVETNVGAPDAGSTADANLIVEPTGDVVLGYFTQTSRALQVRERPYGPGTDFGAPDTISPLPGRGGTDLISPVAMSLGADGTTTFAWRQETGGTQAQPLEHTLVTARRPGEGTLGAPETIPTTGLIENVNVASDPGGNAVTVSWRGFDNPANVHSSTPNESTGAVYASTRPGGGFFTPAATLTPSGAAAVTSAMGGGEAIVAWTRKFADASCTQVEAAAFRNAAGTGLPASLGRVCTGGAENTPPVAPNPATGAGGSVADNSAPRLRINRRAQKVVKSRRIVLSFACSESCSGVVGANVQHKPRKGAKKQRMVRLSVGKFRGQPGKRVSVRWKLSAGQVTAIKKMLTKKGKATFVGKISTIDAAGNRLRVTTRIALKR